MDQPDQPQISQFEQIARIIQALPLERVPQGIVLVVDEEGQRVIDYRMMELDDVVEILDANGLLPSNGEGGSKPGNLPTEDDAL